MAAIGNLVAGLVWVVMFVFICVCVLAIGVLLLSGLVHLIAYLNKQGRSKSCPDTK